LRDTICFLVALTMLIAFSANGHINQYEGMALTGCVALWCMIF